MIKPELLDLGAFIRPSCKALQSIDTPPLFVVKVRDLAAQGYLGIAWSTWLALVRRYAPPATVDPGQEWSSAIAAMGDPQLSDPHRARNLFGCMVDAAVQGNGLRLRLALRPALNLCDETEQLAIAWALAVLTMRSTAALDPRSGFLFHLFGALSYAPPQWDVIPVMVEAALAFAAEPAERRHTTAPALKRVGALDEEHISAALISGATAMSTVSCTPQMLLVETDDGIHAVDWRDRSADATAPLTAMCAVWAWRAADALLDGRNDLLKAQLAAGGGYSVADMARLTTAGCCEQLGQFVKALYPPT